ncbi:MAG TPA: hypothetical protein VFW80_03265, partial [Gaiellaceae bacterium]|nr:hypothetical protein [Gaiellaceae bacterium]
EAVWQPQGGLAAIPRGSSFELVSPASSQTIEVSGTAPAFKPDGTLTYVRGRELVEWSGRCRAGDRLFTLPNDNATARCLHVLLREPARSVAWLTNGRFAATLPHGDLAIFADGRSVFRTALLPAGIARVEASPRRDFFTVWLDGDLLGAFDSNGAPVVMPPVPAGRALACAPDEAWCVLATSGGSVYLFRPGTGDARLRRLDFRARDLAWRS